MKATITCQKMAGGRFELVATVDVDETLVDFEGVVIAGCDDFFHPGSLNGVDTSERITHKTFVGRAVEEGKVAVFLFKCETAAGSFEIGDACEVM